MKKAEYKVTEYTRQQARKYGVTVKAATDGVHKIDVYRNKEWIASVGGFNYSDYPTYMKTHGKEYADGRRRLYKIRHERDRHTKWTRGWLSDVLLW